MSSRKTILKFLVVLVILIVVIFCKGNYYEQFIMEVKMPLTFGQKVYSVKSEMQKKLIKARVQKDMADSEKKTMSTGQTAMYTCPPRSDCWKFQKLMGESWNETKPRAAVYILSRARHHDVLTLIDNLKALETNFLARYPYPVIIFHESNFAPFLNAVRQATKIELFCQEIQFEESVSLHSTPKSKLSGCPGNPSYKQASRFNAKTVYDLPIMRNLEYILRLDVHSHIKTPVPYDLFMNAKEKNIVYMYPTVSLASNICDKYIWETADFYIKFQGIKPYFMHKMRTQKGRLKIFYNNFELSRMDVFTALPYRNFISYIDALGGVLYYRWGDASLKSLAVSIFVRENQTTSIKDFVYSYQKKDITPSASIL